MNTVKIKQQNKNIKHDDIKIVSLVKHRHSDFTINKIFNNTNHILINNSTNIDAYNPQRDGNVVLYIDKKINPNNILRVVKNSRPKITIDNFSALELLNNSLSLLSKNKEIIHHPTAFYFLEFLKIQLNSISSVVNSIGTQSELLSKQNIKLINIADSINKEIDNLNEQIKEARERSNLLNGILGIFFGLSSIIMGIITEDPLLITSGLTQSFSSLAIVIDPSLADEKWARDFSKYGIFALMGDGAEAVQTSVMIVMIGNNLINNIAKSLENLVSKEASSIASKVGTLIQILNDTSILLGMSNQCVELFKNDPQQNEWLMISGLGIMAFAFHALCKVPELRNLIGESNIILVETALNVGTGIAMQCLSAKNKTDNIDLNNIGNKSQIERIILSGIETLKCKSKIIKTLINAMGGVQEFAIRQLGMNTISNGFANAITSYEKFNMDNAKAEQVYNTTQIDILQQSIEVCRANFMQLIQESHATENTMALQMSNLFGTLSQFLQQQSADVATHRL